MLRQSEINLRYKLGGITILTTALALGLAYMILAFFEKRTYEALMIRDLPTQAAVTDYNSRASLTFHDPRSATETLAALQADGRILGAVLYAPDGTAFANYRQKGFEGPLPTRAPEKDGVTHDQDRLSITRHIVMDKEPLGTLYILADLHDVDEMLKEYAGLMLIVMLVSSIVALLMATRLHKGILDKVSALVSAAVAVSRDRNYAVRVVVQGEDELGQLMAATNEMLNQIQIRDLDLKAQAEKLAGSNAELTRVNAELSKQRDTLTRTQRQKAELSAMVVHDLKNPIATVQSLVDMMQNEQLPPRAQRHLATVLAVCQSMNLRVLNLLDIDRSEEGKLAPRRATFDTVTMVRDVCGSIGRRAERMDRRVEVETVFPSLIIDSDRELLRRILENLVDNALKHTPRGTGVIVQVREPQPDRVELSILDEGPGVPAPQRDIIFTKYSWSEPAAEPGMTASHGLGLVFCRTAVEALGGRISVADRDPVGAVFSVVIPKVAPGADGGVDPQA